MTLVFVTHSPEETKELGKTLGKHLKKGDVIALVGDLGTGKTCFVQGVALGLGISEREYVRSPSFIILNEYRGKIPLYHLDFYRLSNLDELINLNLEEYLYNGGVSILEWADKGISLLPAHRLLIHFQYVDEDIRKVEFEGGREWEEVLIALKNDFKGS